MDFDLSSEQSMLKDSVHRLMTQRYTQEARQRFMAEPEGWSRDNWRQFAELGLLGLGFDEDLGGFGGTMVDTMIVLESFGRGLVIEPYLGSVVLGGGILRHAEFGARADMIAAGADGSRLFALAHEEEGARYVLSHVSTKVRRTAGGFVLEGRKINVIAGDSADTLFVTARTGGGIRDQGGISIFAVSKDQAGVTVEPYRAIDGSRYAAVTLAGVTLPESALVGTIDEGFAVLDRAVSDALAAVCGEAVGLMEVMLHTVVEYLKTRNQFGGPLARFQALQHRAAEMYVATEQARSMAIYAAMMAGEPDDRERRRALSFAKVQIGKSLHFVGQQAVQLSGGIGVTDEYIVGQQFKRSTAIERQFGDVDHHLSLIDAIDRHS
ncbi:acyl-CoA dehydrogenase family protein [Oryzicola mucosus]|uniref:Acyl-CoA dehydrogenase family protein n=1 Tax=Oryzicola mucosus TaxID=2767425 RepID=A0A8J6PLJ3_9HYPH|nr:acyl-CoA dehydrogenase [Oryzicola mucosus]MBD0416718.1 acyl-CoA dehydrogenase family protein [Oryzicola mucosus]